MERELIGLGVALGSGLLMGVERERRKGEGSTRRPAGVRSFTLASLVGALAIVTGIAWMPVVAAALIGGLAIVARARDRSPDPGLTTAIALFGACLIGMLAMERPTMAGGVAVIATVLLAAREPLHYFSTRWLRPEEIRDALILTGLALIVVPALPDRPLAGALLNPRRLAQLLAILLAIQAGGHLAQRTLGSRFGLILTGLASGFVSSTATFAAMGSQARRQPELAMSFARAAVASNIAMLANLLVVAAAVRHAWLPAIAGPVAIGLVLSGAFVVPGLWHKLPAEAAPPERGGAFRLSNAVVIAALLTSVQLIVQGLNHWLGDAGMIVAAGLAGLVDVHAASAALFSLPVPPSTGEALSALAAPLSLILAANLVSKLIAAFASGGRGFALRVLPGLLVVTLGVAAAFFMLPSLGW